jgi:hypothetical protein
MTDNVKVAIDELHKTKYDMIFLDHDLDQRIYVDSKEENTGFQVAKELKHTLNATTLCVIHSLNPIGASMMLKAHPFNSMCIPIYLLSEHLIIKEQL